MLSVTSRPSLLFHDCNILRLHHLVILQLINLITERLFHFTI